MLRLCRRQFLQHTSTGLAGGLAAQAWPRFAPAAPGDAETKVCAFTKSFQDLSIAQVCGAFKRIGLDGLDLTVRPGGHIEPTDAVRELPRAAGLAREAGTQILLLTTSITQADDEAEQLFSAAAGIGVDRIKLGYFRYEQFGTLARQTADVRRQLARVAKLAAKYEVLPCVHIHSGEYIPSHGTQLYELLRDFSPDEIGAYVDPLHMTVEGGADGWRQGLDLLGPWIALVAIKNFVWEPVGRDKHGQRQWRVKKVPLADGVAPLPRFIAALEQLGYRGTYSLHSEYKGRRSFQDLDTAGCLKQTEADLKYLRSLL